MAKQAKSSAELQALVLEEARKVPECAELTGVVIFPGTDGHWNVAGEGEKRAVCVKELVQIALKLNSLYYLDEDEQG